MNLPRISDSLPLNNVILLVVASGLALVAVALTVAITMWFARWTARASNVDAMEAAVERIRRPLRVVGSIASMLVVLAACGLLGVSIWREMDLHEYLSRWAGMLTIETLYVSLRVAGVIVGVVVGSYYYRRAVAPLQRLIETRLNAVAALEDFPEVVAKLVRSLAPLVNAAVVYGAFVVGSDWIGLSSGFRWLVSTVIFAVLVLNAARTLVLIVQMATKGIDKAGESKLSGTRYTTYYAGVRGLLPLAQRSFEAVTWLAAATLVVGEFDVLESVALFGPRLINLIAIFFFSRVVVELSRVVVVEAFQRSELDSEAAKRRVTLVYLIQSVLKYLIYFGAALMMLREVGVDPTPFLAGAGIVGLTVGLGAQKLVNDMVSGFFILFEGQILTGDYVGIGGAEGVVEQVSLRVTSVRDNSGRLHIIRNGQIETVINFSRDYVLAVVDVGVAYESDLDVVNEALSAAGAELREAEAQRVLEPTRILGVDRFGDSALVVRTATKVRPGTHLPVERAFRRLVTQHFAARGVTIPFPQLDVHPRPVDPDPEPDGG